MSERNICQVVELDVDYCTITWGVAPCMAEFGLNTVRKCYNTFGTCAYTQAYDKGVKTLRFCEPTFTIKDGNYIPSLVSVGGYEQEVNIAGYSENIGALGKRAAVSVTFRDHPSRDTLTDKYWSERMDGTAQTNEGGYDPIDRGSFWTKFKARNPNYAGRPLRVIQGYIDETGSFVAVKTRAYVMDELKGPDRSGNVTITAKDILSLADNQKALAPIASRGRLLADIDAVVNTATLSPAGIGSEYPASGFATIGSEIVDFTRAGDVLTLVRGVKGTQAASHTANDTVQVAYDVERIRADYVLYDLLTVYGNVPAGYIDFPDWQAEFNRWGNKMLLSATICKPTGVSKLIGEINRLGITVWWDEIAQKIRVKLNHPPDEEPAEWSDRNNIISIETEDNDDERATRIEMWTVQIDPTKDLNEDNFQRGFINISVDSESPMMFGLPRTKQILCRWLNHGDDATVKIITGRLLNRYKRAPVTYKVRIDTKDDPSLTDVISLTSHVTTDVTGIEAPTLTQVFYRADDRNGHTVDARLQMFQFDARYGVITENTRPDYDSSNAEQKRKGSYFVGPSLVFSDGSKAYQFV